MPNVRAAILITKGEAIFEESKFKYFCYYLLFLIFKRKI